MLEQLELSRADADYAYSVQEHGCGCGVASRLERTLWHLQFPLHIDLPSLKTGVGLGLSDLGIN